MKNFFKITAIFMFLATCASAEQSERYKRGLEELNKFDKESTQRLLDSLQPIAPDLTKYIIEYPFGDIYARRDKLDFKSRQISTISALAALGYAKPQLKIHIKAGLNAGLTREEIIEIMTQLSVYAGFPVAINGVLAAQEAVSYTHLTLPTSPKV